LTILTQVLLMQEDGDDFFGEEAAEADAAQGEVRQAIAAANKVNREAEDINPEELERYIKERFEAPSQQRGGAGDFNEQRGEHWDHSITPGRGGGGGEPGLS